VNNCTNVATGVLTVNELPTIELGKEFNICEGEPVIKSIGSYAAVLWSDGSTGTSYSADKSEKIYVLVTNGAGCQIADSVVATLVPMAQSFSLREDTTICEKAGDEVILLVDNQGRDVLWEDGSTSVAYSAIFAGQYKVTLTDSNGCTISDDVVLTTFCTPITFTMPNIFTPNTNGINDYMRPLEMEWADKDFMVANILDIRFYVYNRWGVMVHATEGILPKWDGRSPNGLNCSDGTYFWDLEYMDAAEEKYHLNGFVKLYNPKAN
jgi:gliding motility-associated-like protein